MPKKPLIPARIKADPSNRLEIPKDFLECINWVKGSESIEGWLLMLSSGRFRLLSDGDVINDTQLRRIRSLILEGPSSVADESILEPTFAEDPTHAAIVARLLPTEIARHGTGWRLTFPKAFRVFAPVDCNAKDFMMLFSSEGFWEIWYTDVLRKIAVLPFDFE